MSESAKPTRAQLREQYRLRIERRTAICKACIHYVPRRAVVPALCGDCDCVVAMKVRLPGEKCPRGRW